MISYFSVKTLLLAQFRHREFTIGSPIGIFNPGSAIFLNNFKEGEIKVFK